LHAPNRRKMLFLDPEKVNIVQNISGSRNSRKSVISGSRNCRNGWCLIMDPLYTNLHMDLRWQKKSLFFNCLFASPLCMQICITWLILELKDSSFTCNLMPNLIRRCYLLPYSSTWYISSYTWFPLHVFW